MGVLLRTVLSCCDVPGGDQKGSTSRTSIARSAAVTFAELSTGGTEQSGGPLEVVVGGPARASRRTAAGRSVGLTHWDALGALAVSATRRRRRHRLGISRPLEPLVGRPLRRRDHGRGGAAVGFGSPAHP